MTRQQNAIEMVFRWRADGRPTLNASKVFQGIRTGVAKKPYIFVFFRRILSPLWFRALQICNYMMKDKTIIHIKYYSNALANATRRLIG